MSRSQCALSHGAGVSLSGSPTEVPARELEGALASLLRFQDKGECTDGPHRLIYRSFEAAGGKINPLPFSSETRRNAMKKILYKYEDGD